MLTTFHIAFQVRDIDEAREFYGKKMGLPEGRSDSMWIDYNMFGHQVVAHLNPNLGPNGKVANHRNPVDDHAVPVPHFGVVLDLAAWEVVRDQLQDAAGAVPVVLLPTPGGLAGNLDFRHTMQSAATA